MNESVFRAFFFPRESIAGASVVSADAGQASDAGQGSVPTWRLRAALLAGCSIAIGLAGYVGDPRGFLQADPALARLLRGMALIKGVIAIAVVAAVWWRIGRPVLRPVAGGYLVGSWILAGSTMLIWQLSWIPLAAILFHVAAMSVLCVSWRER